VVDVYQTHGPGDAEHEARRVAAEGKYAAVIGAGGDGTINEVLNGAAGTGLPIGILPWGTANVFCSEMGYPKTISAQCRVIIRGRALDLDVGRCNGRAFMLMAGIGIDAYSLRRIPHLKQLIGVFAYLIGAIRGIFRFRSPRLWFRIRGGERHEAAFILVSNTSRYGGIFRLSPLANPVDGQLDVYAYKERGPWRLMKLVLSMLLSLVEPRGRPRRRMLYLRDAAFRAEQITVESDDTAYVQLDGDYAGGLPADISVEAGGARIILPSRAWRYLHEKAVRRHKAQPQPTFT